MRWLRTLGLDDPAIFPAVGQALMGLVAAEIGPAYELLHMRGSARAAAEAGSKVAAGSAADGLPVLSERLIELLGVVGHHAYHDICTLTKVVRVVVAVGSAAVANPGEVAVEKLERAHQILARHIMPAVALLPSNPALVMEVWGLVKQLPYAQRFLAYATLEVTQGGITGLCCHRNGSFTPANA
jgi:hypothetical protein